MKQTKIILGIIIAAALLSACTLRIGGTSQLPDAPAPTSIPLSETSEGAPPTGLIPTQKLIALPPGFIIHVFAEGLNRPRMMAFGPDKALYVAERGENRVVRLTDLDQNGTADQTQIVAEDLNSPSSLAFYRDGSLYVGETTQILRLSEPDESGVFQLRQVIIDGLPSGGHNTRTVLFSPEWNVLYVSVGSSCNVCEETDPRRAAIVQYTPDGNEERIFASGLRNAVGITFRPGSDQLWVTNNGRDMLGDDLPPETVYWVEEGQDYGWPDCHAGRIIDPEYGDSNSCVDAGKPMIEMQAHSAPLGLTFYDGTQFPEKYHGGLFIAFHGSWNRSTPTGYKVVFVPFLQGKPGSVQDFATGWLTGNSSWGRPVDVIAGPDGSLYVSDDGGGRIFRIFYQGVQ